MYEFCKAAKSDKKSILRFYKSQNYSARFLGYDHCYFVKQNGSIIASVIVSQLAENHSQSLIHALVVKEGLRHQGLATKLIKHCTANHTNLVCFALDKLSPLYLKSGFKLASNSELTEQLSIRFNSYQQKQASMQIFIHD